MAIVEFYTKKEKDSFVRAMKKAGKKCLVEYQTRKRKLTEHGWNPVKKWVVRVK